MSTARHHNEWLSLVEVSGPFLSLPTLLRVFPQGLDVLDQDMKADLRLAYEEWLDDQNSLRPNPAIHTVWVRYVLSQVLGFEKDSLLEGPAIPPNLKAFIAEQGETLRPDMVIINPVPLSLRERAGVRDVEKTEARDESRVRLLLQVYPHTQGLEKSMHGSRWKASPASRMLELLRATGVQLGLVTNGEQWLLVDAPRGETSAYVSWYASLWLEEPLTLRAFTSLLGARRFFSMTDEDTLEGMLKESVNEQQEVTDQLGYQVRRAVEMLIRAVDQADQDRGRSLLKNIPESELYEAALSVMMRLVFLFSAEERGLLLLGDPLYDQNYAVSTLRAQLRETADQQGEEVLERRYDAWCRLLAAFRAVYGGIHHDRLNLPAYGGSLFDPTRYPFLEGRSSPPLPLGEGRGEGSPAGQDEGSQTDEGAPLPISNRTVLHLLEALQVLRVKVPGGGPAEPRRLSFRALDVEQIGHVYEGLLDHIAVRAGEPVLGLSGTRNKEPEIPLSVLRAEQNKDEKSFLAFLKEQTGRSENALRSGLQVKPDIYETQRLQVACNNDHRVFEGVEKYAGLLYLDDFGSPAVFMPGSVYVTAGSTRRATGTHYTPRSLTEPVVQHTLEPLVYTGPAEGLPKEEWKLKTPAQLLELKVCDMAMGSAGFLVQVVRYLSERLVEAWDSLIPILTPTSALTPANTLTPAPLPKGEGDIEEGKEGYKAALSPEMLARVRELRQQATEAEKLLWECLRDRRLNGYKFRRQHPVDGYILDFYCHEAHLAVELDGPVHKENGQANHDSQRTQNLTEKGIKVVRFWNDEVLEETSAVLEKILALLAEQLPPSPSSSPSSSFFPSPPGRGQGEGKSLRITPEGKPATGKPGELIIPEDDEERLILARRLVADRCIYGVDKNPLAVEIAKLSIWLTTMEKSRPFTFLDHAFKCGDSLVGADEGMFRGWAFSRRDAAFTLDLEILNQQLETARQKRRELEAFTVLDVRDAEHKAALLQEADQALERVKLGCDLLVGVRLLGFNKTEQETMLEHLLWDYVAGEPIDKPGALRALAAARRERAFHWPFEFPEVFHQGGFNAFVGNPPFIGGQHISGNIGRAYYYYLKSTWTHTRGSADICAYFFIRSLEFLSNIGTFGFISTNTIAQGDTREFGLDYIAQTGGTIYNAINSTPWPGSATVSISIVHVIKGNYQGQKFLNGKCVHAISSLLDEATLLGNPKRLGDNVGKGYQGSIALGMGFVMSPEEAYVLINQNPINSEVLFPYLNGEDINSRYDQSPSRWIINFGERDLHEAEKYPDCLEIIRLKVKPEREKDNRKARRERWWMFAERAPGLYSSIGKASEVLVSCRVTKFISHVFVPNNLVYDVGLNVFVRDVRFLVGLLNSTLYENWVRKYASSLETRLRYTLTDCFETFPFPKNRAGLEKIGETYHEIRRQIMLSHQEGLTATYNRFHNSKEKSSDIARLRELHKEMDNTVATAYRWNDLELGHGFHETPQGVRFTISDPARREVLSRLLQLNHERYEEEVRQGLHEGKKGKAQRGKVKVERKAEVKPKPRRRETPKAQIGLPMDEEAQPAGQELPDEMPEEPAPTPAGEIGRWDQCICLGCGRHLTGFMIEEHTRTAHEVRDPGYRKVIVNELTE